MAIGARRYPLWASRSSTGEYGDELSGKAALENGITFHLKSPIQYRGLAQVPLERETQEAYQEKVDRILTTSVLAGWWWGTR